MKKTFKVAPIIAALALLGQGCLINFGGGAKNDGGVWRSEDRGDHWLAKGAVLSVGGAANLSGTDILALVPDPQDPQTIYAGTGAAGLLFTVNGGESWQQSPGLAGIRVPSIAVDSKNKCVVYAVTGGVAMKTADCTRTWQKVYEETRGETALNSVAVDFYNPSVLYLGTTRGDVIKSEDAGRSWRTVKVFNSGTNQIAVDPFDSRIIYAGTKNTGVWRSADSGATWTDLSPGYQEFDGGKDFYNLVFDASKKDALVLVCRFGLLRTTDAGAHWDKVPLVTQPGQARIYSLAMNPQNGQEMYYSTATVFYKSSDGGANWTTKRLPTSRAGSALLVSGKNPATVYLGTLLLKQ